MVETSNCGDREKTTTGDSTKSMALQLIQEEMELTEHKYEQLARSDRATTTAKVEPVEKKIEALSKKMTFLTDRLQPPIDQVRIILTEPEQHHTQLGYRGINDTVANQETKLRKFDMPVFAGPLPFDWISRVERFFRFGNYTEEDKLHLVSLSLEGPALQWFNGELISDPFLNWEQFKERMLDRFGGPIDDDPEARLFCLRQEGDIGDYVNEFESLRNQVTGLDEKTLIKVFFNGLKSEMKEVIRIKKPVRLMDYKLAVSKEVVFGTEVKQILVAKEHHETAREKHSTTVEEVSLTSVAEVHQQDLVCEIVPEPDMVKHLAFSTVDELYVSPSDRLVNNCSSPELLLKQDSVLNALHEPGKADSCMEKQQKFSKGWKFKFKSKLFQTFWLRRLVNLHQVSPWESRDILSGSERQLRRLSGSPYQPEVVHPLSCSAVFEQDHTEHNDSDKGDWLFQDTDGRWKVCFSVWLESLRYLCRVRKQRENKAVAERSHCVILHMNQISVVNSFAGFRVGNGSELICCSSLTRHTLEQPKLMRQNFRQRLKRGLRVLQALTQLIVGNAKFQVKHKWRFKQFQVLVLARVACGLTELQQYEFFPGKSPLFLFIPSLWASLFSRDGVYTRIMICWLVEIELIWWFAIARESDLFVKDVRQVWEVWITHYLLNNERCKLLIYIK